jgi:prophage DNA circulation protein
MTTSRERVRAWLTLTPPDKSIAFTPKWRQSPRSIEKKVAQFNYPLIKGTVVKDLDVKSDMWPLQFFFDGPDHDLRANEFVKAIRQRGPWQMIHPVYGFHLVQPLSITEIIDRTDSENITEFNSEWIEGIDPLTLKTAAEMLQFMGIRSDMTSVSAADQFVKNIDTSKRFSLSSAIDGVTKKVNKVLGPIAEMSTAVNKEMLDIMNAQHDLMNAAILTPLSIAGNIQAMVELPLKAINDVRTRMDAYKELATELFDLRPQVRDLLRPKEALNKANVQQLALISTITANAKIATVHPAESGLKSQKQAIEIAQKIADQYDAIVANLDESQVLFEDKRLVDQHFSQESSYFDSALVTAGAIEFLLASMCSLKVERRITLDRPRCPVEIAITEYGGPGEDDENIDMFIESNKLHGSDILLLPALREVLIYA